MRLHNAMKQDKEDAKGPTKTIKVERVDGASCSTTDTGTGFDVSFEIDQSELEQVSVSQYETYTSDQIHVIYKQNKCVKNWQTIRLLLMYICLTLAFI